MILEPFFLNYLVCALSALVIFCLLKSVLKTLRLFFLQRQIYQINPKYLVKAEEDKIEKHKKIAVFIFKRKIIFLLISFTAICVVFFFVFKNIFISIFFSTVSIIILFEAIQSAEEKRKEFFELQIAEFISNMIILLKSGKNTCQIFKLSFSLFKNPLGALLKKFNNEIEFNIPLDEALDSFSKSAGSKELNLLVNAIKIHTKIGGNLLYIAANLLKTVQENINIRTKIKTRTAQSRLSGNIIVFFPAIGFCFMYLVFNQAVEKFISTGLGIAAILASTVLELIGYLIIKKIVREDYL